MVQSKRKRYSDHEQNCEHRAVTDVSEGDDHQVSKQNEAFGRYDVCHNRADEKTFFTLEDHTARVATMFHIEGVLNDRGTTTRRASKLQRARKGEEDRASASLH